VVALAKPLLHVNITINEDKPYWWSVKMLIFQDTAVNQLIGKQQLGMACPDGMRRRWHWKRLLLLLIVTYTVAYAQDKMKAHLSAEQLEGDMIDGEPCKKLMGNVVIALEQFTIHADQAIYYDNRKLIEAQGNVKIIHEDGSMMLADRLLYEEEHHLAKLRSHVVYRSDATTFYTDHFDYDMETKQGHFVQGGKLIEGGNVVTSESGQYNALDKAAIFDKKVKLVNQDYALQCDTLYYSTITKIAQFKGPTKITSKDGKQTLTTHVGGEYNTSNQQSTFAQSKVETEAYTLYGDFLRVDKVAEIYMAIGHVQLVAKEDDVIISGDYGEYQKEQGTAKVYGNALMTKILEEDPLYLSADTFVATENKSSNSNNDPTVRAYHNVKLYKEDFQGKADTMVYQGADSTIDFYGDPIFWSNASQLTADSVHILLQDKAFHEMHMNTHAFVASEDATGNYNQLQGRSMIAFFRGNKIDVIEIDGNAESIYFVVDDNGQLQGMNHLRCSQIRIDMEEDAIAGITFRRKPIGTFYPPHKIVEEAKELEHFNWRITERPTKEEVVAHGYGMQQAYEKFKLNQKH
jgi:lipopolysaccharide export system protein LptA